MVIVYRLGFLCWISLVLVPEIVLSQVTSAQLAEALLQERYLQQGIGTPTLDYLEEYNPDLARGTGLSHHAGIDFAAPIGTVVYSPVSGVVGFACEGPPEIGLNGLGVLSITVDDPSIGGYTVVLLHLSSCEVSVGQSVRAGDRIALSGDVGVPGAPHVHIEVQRGNDIYPCGRGGGRDAGCPFNDDNPTALDVIALATYDPRAVIKSLIFVRDLNDRLKPEQIDDTGLHLAGLNFGAGGRLTVSTNLRDIPDYAAYVNCAGSERLEWEVPSASTEEWDEADITVGLFPHEFSCGGTNFTLELDDLRFPLHLRVLPSGGGATNSLPFPFKDVDNDDQWYTPYIVRAWVSGIVEGYTRPYPVANREKSLNWFDPESSVTHGEALAMVFRASGIIPSEAPDCVCPGTDALDWVYPLVCEGVERGWFTCPLQAGAPANRGFVAAIIAGALGLAEDERLEPVFLDVPQDHPNFRAITFCQRKGIFEGYDDGTFQPEREINRAELARTLNEGFLENQAP